MSLERLAGIPSRKNCRRHKSSGPTDWHSTTFADIGITLLRKRNQTLFHFPRQRERLYGTRGRGILEIGKFSRARASFGRKILKSEKNSVLEKNFSTVAEGEIFRGAKAIFFQEVDFVCVCAPVAIISRAVWKLRNGLRLRGNFEIGKEQCTRKNEIRNSCYTVAEGENFREAKAGCGILPSN